MMKAERSKCDSHLQVSHPAAISLKGREGFFIILRVLGALCVENPQIHPCENPTVLAVLRQ
jgi:hypothetical protein